MQSKKELYTYFAMTKGIFLPAYKLEKVLEELNSRMKKEGFFTVLNSIETQLIAEKEKYSDKKKGAYIVEDNKILMQAEELSKSVLQIDIKTGEVITKHKSLVSATKSIGKNRNEAGNISKVADGRRKSAYGYSWKWAN